MTPTEQLRQAANDFLEYVRRCYIEDRDEAQHVGELAYALEKVLKRLDEESR